MVRGSFFKKIMKKENRNKILGILGIFTSFVLFLGCSENAGPQQQSLGYSTEHVTSCSTSMPQDSISLPINTVELRSPTSTQRFPAIDAQLIAQILTINCVANL